jgi:hypothetical protein
MQGVPEQDEADNLVQIEPSEYRPSPLGVKAHLSLARTKIVRGGLGSGKTRWACEQVNNLCLNYPGSLHLVGRKDLTSLKTTTQKEFLEFVARPQTIDTFHVNDNILYYKNGSQVLFRESKDKMKVKSLQLTSYLLDEADENQDPDFYEFLDDRLRQQFPTGRFITAEDGREVQEFLVPPHQGLLVFNPTPTDHWLYELAQRKDIDVEDFQFSTYDNAHNLPPNYIPNLERKLAPWDRRRLLLGEWGRSISGKPVFHGFTESTHVRHVPFNPSLPLFRSWDFGYGHPAVIFFQIDELLGRVYILREFLGTKQKLDAPTEGRPSVVSEVKRLTFELSGLGHTVMDYGDPHGADEKDLSVSSIEYLRIHHQIFVQTKRERIKTGVEEIQNKILERKAYRTYQDERERQADPDRDKTEPLLIVDPSCKIVIDALLGGYHRDVDGLPKKDGYFDHLVDTIRYGVVHRMNRMLARQRTSRRYRPRNLFTGY